MSKYVSWRDLLADGEEHWTKEYDEEQKAIIWKRRPRKLTTRPIYEHEWPKLIAAMIDDDLEFSIDKASYEWKHGRYTVTPMAVKKAWVLSNHQYRRFIAYLLIHGFA
ncbi:MAG: hypothetical protein HOC79_01805 [Euryarchaeota archaeon]|nr:hypothetical protein [Euryarchaeota archaeon]